MFQARAVMIMYTMQEAAEQADVSYSTVKRYVSAGHVYPRVQRRPGQATGCRYLFTDRDVQRIREIYEDNVTWLAIGLRDYLDRKKSQRYTGSRRRLPAVR